MESVVAFGEELNLCACFEFVHADDTEAVVDAFKELVLDAGKMLVVDMRNFLVFEQDTSGSDIAQKALTG